MAALDVIVIVKAIVNRKVPVIMYFDRLSAQNTASQCGSLHHSTVE